MHTIRTASRVAPRRHLAKRSSRTIMAIWPFRRKSRKRRSRAATTDFDGHRDATPIGQASAGGQAKAGTDRSEPHKLQRRARTYSFSPGRHDSIVLGRKPSVEGKRRVTGPAATFQGPASTDLGRNVFFRVPTLLELLQRDTELRGICLLRQAEPLTYGGMGEGRRLHGGRDL